MPLAFLTNIQGLLHNSYKWRQSFFHGFFIGECAFDLLILSCVFIDNMIFFVIFQIIARDLSTGLSIVSYYNEKSVTYKKMFLENILYEFLK